MRLEVLTRHPDWARDEVKAHGAHAGEVAKRPHFQRELLNVRGANYHDAAVDTATVHDGHRLG